jgi:putative transposase
MSWPHAPSRLGLPPGAYIVTAGTMHKQLFLDSPTKLDLHLNLLFECAREFGWRLEAWAVFANHYHFVAHKHDDSADFETFLGKLHSCSSREINKLDGLTGRKVWYRYWDTHLTYEKSYLARLNYVRCNAVKHKLVEDPRKYKWCSAEWFYQQADRPFHDTVCSFKIDNVNVIDDFD